MGRAPAYVFVVRHGNRLDAANKQWHLHSPTPYDPPLTYSGWNQSKALGVRIGEILRDREADDAAEEERPQSQPQSPSKSRRRRRYKVVIHSSPFLRCVQTSIGISAGLASVPTWNPQTLAKPAPALQGPRDPTPDSGPSPRQRPTISTEVAHVSALADLPTPDGRATPVDQSSGVPEVQKCVIRLDAFLGEWLTPSYFELITPPPSSGLMIAGAKAELLRREDHAALLPSHHHHAHSNSVSGQVWGAGYRGSFSSQTPGRNGAGTGFDSLSSLAGALPRSGSTGGDYGRMSSPQLGAYVPPRPIYAISHSAEIPKGYVSHARDYCLEVDYQWDSMREPLDWGSGGHFGEEWTEMHKRFRRGVQRLIDWYCTTDHPTDMVTKEKKRCVTKGSREDNEFAVDEEEDEDVESVVILVSHGAGCNALIGAITHQPVLMDVGLASLTMAVRKPGKDKNIDAAKLPAVDTQGGSSAAAVQGRIPIHEYYDLKVFAANDHLHAQTPTSSRSPSIAMANRGRNSSNVLASPLSDSGSGAAATTTTTTFSGDDNSLNRSSSAAANLASARRGSAASGWLGGITVGSGVTSFARPVLRSPSLGLWSPVKDEDEEDDVFPNFNSAFGPVSSPSATAGGASNTLGEQPPPPPPPPTSSTSSNGLDDLGTPVSGKTGSAPRAEPQLGSGAGGLWGNPTPRPPGDAERLRDMSSTKRRWTVNERAA